MTTWLTGPRFVFLNAIERKSATNLTQLLHFVAEFGVCFACTGAGCFGSLGACADVDCSRFAGAFACVAARLGG